MTDLLLSAILLAAGSSSRYKGNKLEEKVRGRSILEWTIHPFSKMSEIAEIVIVVRNYTDQITELQSNYDQIKIAINDKAEWAGMASSIVTGLKSINNKVDGTYIHPSDISTITTNDLKLMAQSFAKENGITGISYNGKRGHPTLISKKYFKQLMNLEDYAYGLKSFLQIHQTEITDVLTNNHGILLDLDYPADLQQIIQWFEANYKKN